MAPLFWWACGRGGGCGWWAGLIAWPVRPTTETMSHQKQVCSRNRLQVSTSNKMKVRPLLQSMYHPRQEATALALPRTRCRFAVWAGTGVTVLQPGVAQVPPLPLFQSLGRQLKGTVVSIVKLDAKPTLGHNFFPDQDAQQGGGGLRFCNKSHRCGTSLQGKLPGMQ